MVWTWGRTGVHKGQRDPRKLAVRIHVAMTCRISRGWFCDIVLFVYISCCFFLRIQSHGIHHDETNQHLGEYFCYMFQASKKQIQGGGFNYYSLKPLHGAHGSPIWGAYLSVLKPPSDGPKWSATPGIPTGVPAENLWPVSILLFPTIWATFSQCLVFLDVFLCQWLLKRWSGWCGCFTIAVSLCP